MCSVDCLAFLPEECPSFLPSSSISITSAAAGRLLDLLASELDACVLVLDGVSELSKCMESRKASAALRLGLGLGLEFGLGLGSKLDELDEDVSEAELEVSEAGELSGCEDEISWGGVGARKELNEEAGGVGSVMLSK
jgi:hypothetical protein